MSWLSDIFIPSTSQTSAEQAANYAAQQAEYQRRLQARQEAGTLPADYIYAGGQLEVQDQAAWEGFQEGAAEGAANVGTFLTDTLPGTVNKTISATVGSVFSAIPVSLWLLAAVALFVWMGGLTVLRGKLAPKS